MLAMTVLLIGSASVMSMQKSAIQSNLDARKLDIANSIAHDWLERLQRDATQWTLPSNAWPGLASNFSNTTWLSYAAFGTWFEPAMPTSYGAPGAEGYSPAFDILGRDLDSVNAPNAVFCAHVKIDELAKDPVDNSPVLLRATVVVFWQKQLVVSESPLGGNCMAYFDVAADEAGHPGTWHIIYASTAIKRNTLQ
jgi:hypothetical protein